MRVFFRIILLPLAVVVEFALLAVAFLLAPSKPDWASRITAFAKRKLPDLDWYFSSRSSSQPNAREDES